MNTEEKARRYDEAFERAKDFMNGEVHYELKMGENIMCWIFPELRESEDERIREDLIAIFKGEIPYTSEEDAKRYIAWLEKQGEQKVSEYDVVKTIKERIIEHFDNHLITDKCFSIGGLKDDILKIINEVKFEKKGEQKPTQEIEPFEAEHGKYYYCIKDYFCGGRKQASKGDVVQALRGLPIMGLKDASEYFLPVNFIKCNPAWSEEDETALGDALWCCKQAASIAKDENDMGNTWYAEKWLKSLKQRMEE